MNSILIAAIQKNLTPDLLNSDYWLDRNKRNPMAGHCYVASEAYFYLAGEVVLPCVMHLSLGTRKFPVLATHWFLKNQAGLIIDITASQFSKPPDYATARGCGFLTKGPSKRAQVLIERVMS